MPPCLQDLLPFRADHTTLDIQMSNMADQVYSMSFTTGTLLYRASITLAEHYRQLSDWDAVRTLVVNENLLQVRTLNASKRICREVTSRLKLLTPVQIDLLTEGIPQEQHHLLWLAVCKRYHFIYDFAVEILREKFLRLDFELTFDDYNAFFNAKAEWHPEMERIADSTRGKQRQFIFKMMREADLLSADNQIRPALLTPALVEAIREDNPAHFSIFPVFESDIP